MGPAESLGRRAETTLVDDIVDAIRERILLGELEPGLRIRQQQFAEVLGVSRTPLREAFQRLEADGWLQLRARRGAEVRPLTVDEACEIFTMRVVLETTAARLAARSHSEGDAARARALLERIPWGFDGASQNLTSINRTFHEQIYGLQSPDTPRELTAALRGYWTRALRYRLVYWRQAASIGLSRSAHEAILEAFTERDADATERAVAHHILTALCGDRGADRRELRLPRAALHALAERYRVDLPTTHLRRHDDYARTLAAVLPRHGGEATRQTSAQSAPTRSRSTLEDAVADDRKVEARSDVHAALKSFGDVRTFVRVNHPSTRPDRRATSTGVMHPNLDGIVLPKVESVDTVRDADAVAERR